MANLRTILEIKEEDDILDVFMKFSQFSRIFDISSIQFLDSEGERNVIVSIIGRNVIMQNIKDFGANEILQSSVPLMKLIELEVVQ